MSEGKRKHQGGHGGAKKRYKSDGSKISSTTIHGPGVIVTCVKGKEAQAGREIRDVFESIADELWPVMDTHSKGENPDNGDDDDSDGDDIEAQLVKDHSKVKADDVKRGASFTNATRKRFLIHSVDSPCLTFIACTPPIDPVQLTVRYLENVERTGTAQTHAVQRLEPISNTTQASVTDICVLAKRLIPPAFQDIENPSKPFKYKIVHKIRNNSKVTKEELITALASIVPEGHSVSLDDPELVILVNVYKGIGGLSIVPKYETLKRYNVAQLVNAKELDGSSGGVLSRIA